MAETRTNEPVPDAKRVHTQLECGLISCLEQMVRNRRVPPVAIPPVEYRFAEPTAATLNWTHGYWRSYPETVVQHRAEKRLNRAGGRSSVEGAGLPASNPRKLTSAMEEVRPPLLNLPIS